MPNFAESETRKWLEDVVIGLKFCPFARQPYQNGRVRLSLCHDSTLRALTATLLSEIQLLEDTPAEKLETSVIIVEQGLEDFYDYLDCLAELNALIAREGYEGLYQLASFHPNYRFAGTQADDRENFTNRSPYPLFHLLRERSVSAALASSIDSEAIPKQNIERLNGMTDEAFTRLFLDR